MPKKSTVFMSRFVAIETLLIFEGEVSNRRLRALFDLQPVQASRTIAAFRRAYPNALREDRHEKRFAAAANFKPQLAAGTFDEYQQYFRSNEGLSYEDARVRLQEIVPSNFIAIRNALAQRQALNITYESLSEPRPRSLVGRPVQLIRTLGSWYLRVWCQQTEQFENLTVTDILSARVVPPPPLPLPADELWQRSVSVRLVAHSQLSASHERIVRAQYFRGTTGRRIATRAALLRILLSDLKVAVQTQHRPPEYLLEVSNISELRPYLKDPLPTSSPQS